MSVLCSMVGASFVTAAAEVIRRKKNGWAVGNAKISTAQSKFGGASALFDGTGDVVVVTKTTDISLTHTQTFTIEFWIRSTTPATQSDPLGAHEAYNSPYAGWDFSIVSSKINFYNGSTFTAFDNALSANTWYHVAVVSTAGSIKMYQDGVQQTATPTLVSNFNNTVQPLTIGAAYSDGLRSVNGYIDEVRISNTARYTANFTPSTTAFTNDSNTLFLMHMDGTNNSTFFEDDNGVRGPKRITGISTAQVDTAQSKFGGSSLYLDGNWSTTNAMLNVGDSSSFPITSGNWTIECWIRLPATNLTGLILDFRGNANNFVLYHANTDLIFFAFGSARITASATLSANTWHHVAVSKSGSSTKMFKDGTQVGSTYTDNNTYTASGLGIGTSFLSSGGSSNYEGWIDEVRISDTARYTANFTAPTAPFVNDSNTLFLSHMDGTDASTVFRDDNGTGRSQRGITAVGNAQVSTAQSQFGGASMSVSIGYLQIADNLSFSFGTGDFTIELWFRPTELNSVDILWDQRPNGSQGIQPTIYTSGQQLIYYTNQANRITGSNLSFNTWHHIAVSRSGTSTKMFVNGTQVGSTYTDTNNYVSSSAGIRIGSDQFTANSNYSVGNIDEVRISNTARYTANFTPSTTPFQNDSNTLLLLHMDGTNASTVFTDDNGVYPA